MVNYPEFLNKSPKFVGLDIADLFTLAFMMVLGISLDVIGPSWLIVIISSLIFSRIVRRHVDVIGLALSLRRKLKIDQEDLAGDL